MGNGGPLKIFLVAAFLLAPSPSLASQPTKVDAKISNIPRTAFGEVAVANQNEKVSMMFPYGIQTSISSVTTTGDGTVTGADSMAVLQTGASANSSAILASKVPIRYHPGRGTSALFTGLFTPGVDLSSQAVGMGDTDFQDALAFGYNGTEFGILHINASTPTWYSTSSWNVDKMDGTGPSKMTIDPTKLNVYKISYQFLGAGAIMFYVEDDDTGKFQLVHRLDNANSRTTPTLGNPALRLGAWSANHANTTNVTVKTASMGGFVEGQFREFQVRGATGAFVSAIGTSETYLFSLKVPDSFQGKTNRTGLKLLRVNMATAGGTKLFEVRAYLNASLTNANFGEFTPTSSHMTQTDFAATAFSGS